MQLPHSIQTLHLMECFERCRCTAFRHPVIHYRNSRFESSEGCEVGCIRPAMMRNQVGSDGTDQIIGASQCEQWLTGDIADIEKAEFSEAQSNAGGARILV